MKDWLTAAEVAEILDVHINRAHTLIRNGVLGEVRDIEGYRRVSQAAVEAAKSRKAGRPREKATRPDFLLRIDGSELTLDVKVESGQITGKQAQDFIARVLREAEIDFEQNVVLAPTSRKSKSGL